MKSKWYNQILTALIGIFVMDENSTEQEVHARIMETEDLLNDAKAEIRTELEGEFQETIAHLQSRIVELEEQNETLTEALTEMTERTEQAEAAVQVLEAETDGEPTSGETTPPAKSKERKEIWMNNPINIRAQKQLERLNRLK